MLLTIRQVCHMKRATARQGNASRPAIRAATLCQVRSPTLLLLTSQIRHQYPFSRLKRLLEIIVGTFLVSCSEVDSLILVSLNKMPRGIGAHNLISPS